MLADQHGTVIHLGERDCSIQRRHQKIVEETPSPIVTPELRAAIGKIGVDAARAVGYTNAGTVEGLLVGDTYYFLEMNTRLQVEHTITEEVTGLDLVREQLRIASGEPLGYGQDDVRLTGHSIQCRINAEDPARGFMPTPGLITRYQEPSGPGVRVDSGVVEGATISGLYDPMVAKLVVWDQTRETARRRMLRALSEFEVGGVDTLIPIHQAILEHPAFIAGGSLHEFVEGGGYAASLEPGDPVASAASRWRPRASFAPWSPRSTASGSPWASPRPSTPAARGLAQRRAEIAEREKAAHGATDVVTSPMQGTVLQGCGRGRRRGVAAGDVLVVVEAMKMENEIVAHHAGTVEAVEVSAGDAVSPVRRSSSWSDQCMLRPFHRSAAVAALELLARAARARVVSADVAAAERLHRVTAAHPPVWRRARRCCARCALPRARAPARCPA